MQQFILDFSTKNLVTTEVSKHIKINTPMIVEIARLSIPGIIGLVGENYFVRSAFPAFYTPSSLVSFLPCGYGAVIAINIIGSAFALQTLGTQVGAARKKFIEKAKKDGDVDAEERFSYPKIYAEGFSKHAKDFNCIQRGHQHALETYPQFIVLSLIGGVTQPMLTCVGGLLWMVARFMWAKGYATGEPSRRYENFLSRGVWTALLVQLIGASATALSIANLR